MPFNDLREFIDAARKIDDLTIEIQLEAPDAVLPDKLPLVAMVSKAWCVKNGVERICRR